MNIQALKLTIAGERKINLPTLMMVRQVEQDNPEVQTKWLSHWDNDNRVRITMHEDVFTKIKAEPTFDGLAVKREQVPANNERQAYWRYVVIIPTQVEGTF